MRVVADTSQVARSSLSRAAAHVHDYNQSHIPTATRQKTRTPLRAHHPGRLYDFTAAVKPRYSSPWRGGASNHPRALNERSGTPGRASGASSGCPSPPLRQLCHVAWPLVLQGVRRWGLRTRLDDGSPVPIARNARMAPRGPPPRQPRRHPVPAAYEMSAVPMRNSAVCDRTAVEALSSMCGTSNQSRQKRGNPGLRTKASQTRRIAPSPCAPTCSG